MSWDIVVNFFIALLAIANPVGKVPVWVRAAGEAEDRIRWRLALIVTVAAGSVLLLCLVLGRQALQFFQIDLAAFRVGGGIVLVTIGLGMIQGRVSEISTEAKEDEPTSQAVRRRFQQIFVPMSFPLIAGPGTITTVIIYSSRAEDLATLGALALSLTAILTITFFTLLAGPKIQSWVGDIPLEVVTRVFGLFLVGIAAQFILEGIGEVFPRLLLEDSPIADDVTENKQDSEASQGNP